MSTMPRFVSVIGVHVKHVLYTCATAYVMTGVFFSRWWERGKSGSTAYGVQITRKTASATFYCRGSGSNSFYNVAQIAGSETSFM